MTDRQLVMPLAMGVLLLTSPLGAEQATHEVPTIVTAGEAVITRAPDRAWIVVATDARAPRAADARKLGAQAMTDVQTALRATGLAADAVRTVAYSLEPETVWTNGQPSVKDYVAHNQIEVRVDELDKLPEVLDAASTSKNVSLVIQGPRFDVRDREALEKQALASAVEDAISRAQAMAQGAKLTLGPIQSIENESPVALPVSPLPLRMAGASGGVPSTPVTPGAIEIRAEVRLTIAVR